MDRGETIKYIKSNSSFYMFVDFSGHTEEQLEKIKLRIEDEVKVNKKIKQQLQNHC